MRVMPIDSVPSYARDRIARARALSSPFGDSGVEAPSRQELGFCSFGFGSTSGQELVCAGVPTDVRELHSSELASCRAQEAGGGQAVHAASIQCQGFVRRGGVLTSARVEAPRGGGKSGDGADNFFRDLKAWLQARGQGSPDKGGGRDKGKSGKPGKGKGKQQAVDRPPASSNGRDDQVLRAVIRLVQRAEAKGTHGICERLRNLVHHAEEGQKLTSGRAARKQKAKDKKGQQQQSFYDSKAWLTENQGSSSYSAGKGKGQQPMEGWHVDRSLQAITAGEARKRLEAQQPLGAASIVVKDSEQATVLQNLAKVHEVKDKVAIISQRDLGDGATTRDVTCVKGDRREVREWKAVPLTSAGSSETPTVRLKSSFQPPALDLQTVRIIAARGFMEPAMWANLQGSPRDVVTKLLGSKPIRAEGWKLVSGPQRGSVICRLSYLRKGGGPEDIRIVRSLWPLRRGPREGSAGEGGGSVDCAGRHVRGCLLA